MARLRFTMQKVTRRYQATPVSWREYPELRERSARGEAPLFIELACGHCKRDPLEVYSNETAVRVALVFSFLEPDAPRKARCYKCVPIKN